jgi:hypothetical protein
MAVVDAGSSITGIRNVTICPESSGFSEWHRAVREFFYPIESDLSLETHFVHADEAETSVAFLFSAGNGQYEYGSGC